MCMGIPKGRGKMGGFHMGKVIFGGPDRNKYFTGSNLVFLL